MSVRLALLIALSAVAVPLLLSPQATPPQFANTDMRIGLAVDVPRVRVGGTQGLLLRDPVEGVITAMPDSTDIEATAAGGEVILRYDRIPDVPRRVILLEPLDSLGVVLFNGRGYRGILELRASGQTLVVINRVPLEDYLVGVVSAEMGTRTAAEMEALKAQAVAARTYALRNRGHWSERGFDLIAGVNDQAYNGLGAETPLARDAVAATRGEVLTFDGDLISAFYFSTCSGHTEDGRAAFSGADLPYLRSVSDLDSTGTAWCIDSPRYTWSESWSGTQFSGMLNRSLPAAGLTDARANDLTDIRIVDRTASRRVALLQLVGKKGRTEVTGQAIRQVLSPAVGSILRSNDFTVRLSKQGGHIVRVQIAGRGNGHGVGMCQWGAIGRARAGQDYRTILTSYFPGTALTRLYQ